MNDLVGFIVALVAVRVSCLVPLRHLSIQTLMVPDIDLNEREDTKRSILWVAASTAIGSILQWRFPPGTSFYLRLL